RRRRVDGGYRARRGTDRLVRFRHRAIHDHLLVATVGRRGGGRLGRRTRVRARVHGGGKSRAARVPPSAAVVAGVVGRGGRVARGARAHAWRLWLRAYRAGARRVLLLRDEPLARLV